MRTLFDLILVLAAIIVIAFVASVQGDNIGANEGIRTAKGAAIGGCLLAISKVYTTYKQGKS